MGLVIVALSAVTFVTSSHILRRGFLTLEKNHAHGELQRVLETFTDDVDFTREEDVLRLSRLIHYPLTVYRLNDQNLPLDFQAAKLSLSDQSPILVQPLTDDVISGYFRFQDLYRKSPLLIRVDMDRGIFREGRIATRYILFFIATAGLLFLAISLLLLERTVLARLARLRQAVESIGRTKQGSLIRVPVEGGDELAFLGTEINGMLDSLEESRLKLIEEEEQFRDLFENVDDMVQLVTPAGRYLFVNRAWRDNLGYGENEIASLTMFDVIHPDFRDHCRTMIEKVMAGEAIDLCKIDFVTKGGRRLAVEGGVNCRRVLGKPYAIRGMFHLHSK